MTEAELGAALAAALSRRLPGFVSLTSCTRLSGGANQETYRVVIATHEGERHYALRRAASGAMGALTHEVSLLRAARAAGVPEPEIVLTLEPGDGLGEGFLMQWLEGETLGARIVKHESFAAVRPRLARQCGEVLARIHTVDISDLKLQRQGTAKLVRDLWKRYQGFGTPQPMIDYSARWLLANLPPSGPDALVHNDFRNGNLMITPQDGVVAVLDWELAYIGDPLRDLGWLCTNSWRFGRSDLPVGGFGEVEDLLAGYRAAGGREVTREQLHWWTVFGSYWWAVGTLMMAQAWRAGLDKSAERAAVGRRSSECQIDCVNLLIPGSITAPAAATPSGTDFPRSDELLSSVRDFLRDDVTQSASGRAGFMARVAANSLDIVLREQALGPALRAAELARLQALLGQGGELKALRAELCAQLRSEAMPLDAPGLTEHLRQSVADQIAIDQPGYSGYQTALQNLQH